MSQTNPIQIGLHAQVALVTGASGELGRVIALTLARSGAKVAIHYHQNRTSAETLLSQITDLGVEACVVQADLANASDVRRMHAEVESHLGAVTILVLNAVRQYTWKPLLEQDPQDFQGQFDTIVMQAVYMTQAFVPAMVKAGHGRVIAISTECVMQCLPTQSAYVSGKRGLDGLMRVLAREVGPNGITVNQVAPGWTVSEKDRIAHTERQEGYESGVPLRRRGTDQDIANAVVFLASDLASFITGAVIPVSGGNVMPTV